MRTRRMLATVAAATVAVVAVTGGSVASAATGSPSAGKGSVAVAANAKPGPDKGDHDTRLRKIAASLHVSLAKLENALRHTPAGTRVRGVSRRATDGQSALVRR